ncbi:MAG: phosphatase PAP2 family protein [Bacteroidia bacterium]
MIKATLRQNMWFYGPYLILILLSSVFLLKSEKGAFVLLLQIKGTPMLDRFFVFYTHVGDGFFVTAVALLLLFINKRQALSLGIGLILTGLISQLLKNTLGSDAGRPVTLFDAETMLRQIDYLNRHMLHSMPSGHSSAAFCLFSMLALFSVKKTYGYVFLSLAVLVGLSRMYLAQHFLADVVAGSFIGCFIGLLAYFLGNRWFGSVNMQKPLISLG